jgi:uncharacterized repeat protein (TIGR04138 family)
VSDQFMQDWKFLRDKAGPFPPQAYQFVREGLAHTVKNIHGDTPSMMSEEEGRHVSGGQLCMGLRDFALKQYGRLAKMVLASWNITETADFGRIVFAMIDAGLMRKTEEDTMDDFQGVFDFEEAFGDLSVKG